MSGEDGRPLLGPATTASPVLRDLLLGKVTPHRCVPLDGVTDCTGSSSPAPARVVLDPRRFYVLALFVWLVTNQCLFWFAFSSGSTPGVSEYYAVDDAFLDLLLGWGAIFGVVTMPFATWLLSQPGGLKRSMQWASTLMLLCCVVRLIPSYLAPRFRVGFEAKVLLSVAQILNAAAGPLVMGSCSMVSAVWFSPASRGTATAVAYLGGNIGGGLGYVFGPALIGNVAENTKLLLEVELALAAVPFVLTFMYLPPHPATPPSGAVKLPGRPVGPVEWVQRVYVAASHRPMLALAVIAGVEAGVQSTWGGLIPQDVGPPRFSTRTGAVLGVANTVAMLAGNLTGGLIGDVLFQRRYKLMLMITFAAAAICFAGYAISLPSAVSETPLLPSTALSVTAWATAAGFFQGCADPVLFELSAEMTFDHAQGAEGISGGLIVLVWNLASCVTLLSAPYIHGAATINIVTAGTFVAVSCGTALFVCESYGRQDAETRLAARRLNHGLNTAANPRLYSARAHDDA